MAIPLQMDSVSRSFTVSGKRTTVVENISLTVHAGEIVALLGPNGAGKTTTVSMAATLLAPDSGSITISGIDARTFPQQARSHLSLALGGERGFYMRATVLDNMRYFARLAGVQPHDVEFHVKRALEQVQLTDRANDRVESLSRGMRQRLHIARALASQAELLLLDEPTNGLDPEKSRELIRLIGQIRSERSVGILLTSHIMSEVQALADRIVIINHGRILTQGTLNELAQIAHVSHIMTFTTQSFNPSVLEQVQQLVYVSYIEVNEKYGLTSIDVALSESAQPEEINNIVALTGWQLFGNRPATLEEMYLAIISAHEQRGQNAEQSRTSQNMGNLKSHNAQNAGSPEILQSQESTLRDENYEAEQYEQVMREGAAELSSASPNRENNAAQ